MFYIISSLRGGPNFSEGAHILQENEFPGSLFIEKISSGEPILGGRPFLPRHAQTH